MKNLRSYHLVYLWLLILCLTYASCRSGTPTLSPQLTQFPTNTATLTPIPSPTITYTPTITPTSTLLPTPSPVAVLEANWLTLPAPTISANNIDHIQFQTKLGLAGPTALSPDNKYLAVINGQRIALYNFKNLVEISLQPDDSEIAKEVKKQVEFSAITFSPDSTMLVATYNTALGGGFWIWKTVDGELLFSSSDRWGWTYSLTFSPDGTTLALGNYALIVLFDLHKFEVIRHWEAHTWIVDDLVFSPDGTILASVSRDNSFNLWNVSDGTKIFEAVGTQDVSWLIAGFSTAAYSPKGDYIAVGSSFGFIRLYQIDGERNIKEVKEWKADKRGSVNDLAFSLDEMMLVSASYSGVEFWALPDCVSLKKLTGAGGPLKFSSDGTLLLAGNQFWTVK